MRSVELFATWHEHHGDRPIKAVDLAEPVQALVDPQGRSRQFIVARLRQLTGTRAGGSSSVGKRPLENGVRPRMPCGARNRRRSYGPYAVGSSLVR